jgi:hypothetical protein
MSTTATGPATVSNRAQQDESVVKVPPPQLIGDSMGVFASKRRAML